MHSMQGDREVQTVNLIEGECLEEMAKLPDASVDLVLCDLPYGTTACKWDSVIPFEPLWEQYKRIAKPTAVMVFTSSQPFTSMLVMSNVKDFRYQWVWQKTVAANFMLMKSQPSKLHEDVLVFSAGKLLYNPQMQEGRPYTDKPRERTVGIHGGAKTLKKAINNKGTRYPSSVQAFPNPNNKSLHPTQKPVALMEYLIRTYTNEGMTVLDNCMGSGTTGVACVNTGRSFIGIEKDPSYFKIATDRIEKARELYMINNKENQ